MDLASRAEIEAFIKQRLQDELQRTPVRPRAYRLDNVPPPGRHEGEIIYVPDAAAGANFQGSIGSAWVNLG